MTHEHESYVSIETAKLLKQAGFDWKIYTGYITYEGGHAFTTNFQTPYNFNRDTKDLFSTYGDYKEVLSKPTLAVAQRWLREVKGIRFYITPKYYSHFNDNGEFTHESFAWYNGACDDFDDLEACYIGGLKKGDKVNEEGISEGVRKTYEEVLDEGLQRCLTLLLNNKE